MVNILDYGASTASNNNSPYIQAMVDAVGYFRLPTGDFKVQDQINILPIPGVIFSGEGKEKSRLIANNMEGSNLLSFNQANGLYRFSFRDLGVVGDSDCAFYVGQGVNQLYETEISNSFFSSKSSNAIHIEKMFSTLLRSVDASSYNGHAFCLSGGVACSMINTYAHNVGPNKAGYRISGDMTMIATNGQDSTGNTQYGVWIGHPTLYPSVRIIGSNIESFGDAAVLLDGAGGRLKLEGVIMSSRSSGDTFTCYIRNIGGAYTWNLRIDEQTVANSGGATMIGSSLIVSRGFNSIYSRINALNGSAKQFRNFYNTVTASLQTISDY